MRYFERKRVFNFQFQIFNFKFSISNFQFQIFNFKFSISNFQKPSKAISQKISKIIADERYTDYLMIFNPNTNHFFKNVGMVEMLYFKVGLIWQRKG